MLLVYHIGMVSQKNLFLNQLSTTQTKISIINRLAYKFQTKLHTLS